MKGNKVEVVTDKLYEDRPTRDALIPEDYQEIARVIQKDMAGKGYTLNYTSSLEVVAHLFNYKNYKIFKTRLED